MTTSHAVERRLLAIDRATLESFEAAAQASAPVIAAAHPASAFGAGTAELLGQITGSRVFCINPRGIGGSTPADTISLEAMVDDLEAARRALSLPPWIFWGMSGGGWLAQIYAHRFPDALAGIIIESACCCFRERLADPSCVLSPYFPAWLDPLRTLGLLSEGSHADPCSGVDTEWVEVKGMGHVFRRLGGPALLVSPGSVDESMRRAMPALWEFDSRAWVGTIRSAALVIAGAADPVVPVHLVRKVHESIGGSSFACIDEGGHVPSAERRAEAIDAVRAFLGAHRAPAHRSPAIPSR